MPGGYYKKELYRPSIIEEQFYSLKTKDEDTAKALIEELTSAAGRKVCGLHYDQHFGGIYFLGRTKYDVTDYNTNEETKFFFDFLAITSPFESPGTPLSIEFYRMLVDVFYDWNLQYLNEHTLFFMFEDDKFVGKTFSLNHINEDINNSDEIEESWYSNYVEAEYFDDEDDENGYDK